MALSSGSLQVVRRPGLPRKWGSAVMPKTALYNVLENTIGGEGWNRCTVVRHSSLPVRY